MYKEGDKLKFPDPIERQGEQVQKRQNSNLEVSSFHSPTKFKPAFPFRLSERRGLLLFMDFILVNCAIIAALWFWTAGYVSFSWAFLVTHIYWFPVLCGLWFISGALNNFYDIGTNSRLRSTLKALCKVTAMLLTIYIAVYFLSSPGELPRRFVFYFIGTSFVIVGFWRFFYTINLGRSQFNRKAIIITSPSITPDVIEPLRISTNPYYEVIGYVPTTTVSHNESVDLFGLTFLGSTTNLIEIATENHVSEIIVNMNDVETQALIRILIDCQEQGIQLTPLSVLYEELTERVPLAMASAGFLSVLPLEHASTGVIFPFFKRLVDILLSVSGLICLIPFLPLIAAAIKIDSRGAVFYPQKRTGRGGRTFVAYKFRSMTNQLDPGISPLWTEKNDSRITRVGKLLRSTHVDEFPQFWNIFKGDMSAVGPRPERSELAEKFDSEIPFYRLRHSVRPGMAGWALIKQGNTSSVEDALKKLEYDLYYIKHQSMWLDITILLKTFVDAVAFRGR